MFSFLWSKPFKTVRSLANSGFDWKGPAFLECYGGVTVLTFTAVRYLGEPSTKSGFTEAAPEHNVYPFLKWNGRLQVRVRCPSTRSSATVWKGASFSFGPPQRWVLGRLDVYLRITRTAQVIRKVLWSRRLEPIPIKKKHLTFKIQRSLDN